MNLNDRLNQIVKERKDFFNRAFEGLKIAADIRSASERICQAYGIRGICDPAYIANIIAMETGKGDGKGNFWDCQQQ